MQNQIGILNSPLKTINNKQSDNSLYFSPTKPALHHHNKPIFTEVGNTHSSFLNEPVSRQNLQSKAESIKNKNLNQSQLENKNYNDFSFNHTD